MQMSLLFQGEERRAEGRGGEWRVERRRGEVREREGKGEEPTPPEVVWGGWRKERQLNR